MSIEQLLAPRILVLSPYPFSPYKVGDVISCSDFIVSRDIDSGDTWNIMKFDDAAKEFPNIFRILNWWEHRKIEDLPLFVKLINGADIKEVESYFGGGKCIDFKDGLSGLTSFWIPATEQECLTYLKQL